MAKNILLIDDDRLILGTLKRLLRGEGYNVTVAESGYEALEKIKSGSFDLIISDIRMSSIDGIKTLKQIRKFLTELGKELIPELVITGYDNDRNRQRASELKVAGYIAKPFDLEELLSNIEKNIKTNKTV